MKFTTNSTVRTRKADPREILADNALAERVNNHLEGAPWDVFTTPEVASALRDDLCPLALNDWFYRRAPCAPPRQPMHIWHGNKGFYRKDALLGWIATGGRAIQPFQVWQLSADYLSSVLSLRHPHTLRDTEEDILWLLDRGITSLRARSRYGRFLPFTDTPVAANPEWGRRPDFPAAIVVGQ